MFLGGVYCSFLNTIKHIAQWAHTIEPSDHLRILNDFQLDYGTLLMLFILKWNKTFTFLSIKKTKHLDLEILGCSAEFKIPKRA